MECADQPFDSESTGSSEDTDLIPIHSGEDWVALLDVSLSQPSAIAITRSLDFSPLQRFFTAAVDQLQLRCDAMPTAYGGR